MVRAQLLQVLTAMQLLTTLAKTNRASGFMNSAYSSDRLYGNVLETVHWMGHRRPIVWMEIAK